MRHNSEVQQHFDFKKSPAGHLAADNQDDLHFHSPEGFEVSINPAMKEALGQSHLDQQLLKHYHQLYPLLADYYLNPLAALVNSKTMLLPHQVQAAHHIVSSSRPRFLIADEVGLGKTIEAGLIIKELMLKHDYRRVLICVPAPLVYQWQNELKGKFNEQFEVLTGKDIKKPGILDRHDKVLVSIDLAKDHRDKFSRQHYDIVVFDEAHRLRREVNKVTRAYQFAEDVIEQSVPQNGAVLLLSATPFRGKLEEIYYLISLLDKDILGPVHSFLNRYQEEGAIDLREKLQPVVLRRRKVDVGGFTKRFAKTVKINLSPAEAEFYRATNEYVMREYNLALKDEKNMKSFVMIVFQKILDSSTYALLNALARRKERLEHRFNLLMRGEFLTQPSTSQIADDFDLDEVDSDLEVGGSINPQELRQEIAALNRLIILGSRINHDSKLNMVNKTIKEMFSGGHQKIIIFTQFKNTLQYLAEALRKKYLVSVFHGGLSAQEKEQAIEEFWQSTQVLICTEAGGEGRNLQVASALLNYDLPWSPLKVEQRIGRIHRFGQQKDVHIVNFACKDTVAERVIDILEQKIKLFESALGPSDSLLGTLEEEKKFSRSIFSFLKSRKSKKENDSELESAMKLAKDNAAKIDQLVTPEFLDFNTSAFSLDRNNSLQVKKEKLLERIISANQPLLEPESGYYCIQEGQGVKKATFSYEQSSKNQSFEFLALGHKLVDQAIHSVIDQAELAPVNWVHSVEPRGFLCHFKAVFQFEKTYKRYYSVFYNADSGTCLVNQPPEVPYDHVQSMKLSLSMVKSHLEVIWHTLAAELNGEIEKVQGRLQSSRAFWRNQFTWANQQRNQEFNEKVELQKSKLKWYKTPGMNAALSRTLNKKKKQNATSAGKLSTLNKSMNSRIMVDLRQVTIFSEIKGEKFS